MSSSTSFKVLHDTLPHDNSLPPFMVSTTRGFLPRAEPVAILPPEFDIVESLLQRMPIKMADGSPGLLARGEFGKAVEEELPDLSKEIERHRENKPLMTALYRDYSFIASAYVLEPCHVRLVEGKEYGLGRDRLPRNISIPIATVAAIAGFQPFMEYAGSYALYNYRLEDPSLGLEYDNVRLIRAFEHGLHPTSSEAGFVLVHVAMVRYSGPLVAGSLKTLEGCEQRNRDLFNEGLAAMAQALTKVNTVMNIMWTKSKPNEYHGFRTFIFGIKSQSMFPNGVVYEGVSDEPMYFRGESGANDSMIPLCDNILQIDMPDTPLTTILKDFRSYRPGDHREFLEWVADKTKAIGVREYALSEPGSAKLYLQALDQVRDFRWRHWCFTREYILKHTAHATATGGSPIVTWLPNQLQAVLDQMMMVEQKCVPRGDDISRVMDLVRLQSTTLKKEVQKYCQDRQVAA